MTNAASLPEGVVAEAAPCALGCPAGNDRFVLNGRDSLHGIPGVFSVVKCWRCGLMRTTPRPTQASIGAYYPEQYGPYASEQESTTCLAPASSRFTRPKAIVAAALEMRNEYLPDMPTGRMLEIGCGTGSFLSKMALAGWDVQGLEFSQHAATIARSLGHRITVGPIESTPVMADDFNLGVGWMVLEHLHNPVQALRNLNRSIRLGGWLVLSVPDASALEFRFFGSSWYALQLPTHLHHFSPTTLRRVVEAGGWRFERIVHQRVLSTIPGSIGLLLAERNVLPRLSRRLVNLPERPGNWNAILFPLAALLAAVGQTGRMTVWARKV